jgi:hypothetical protein
MRMAAAWYWVTYSPESHSNPCRLFSFPWIAAAVLQVNQEWTSARADTPSSH